MPTWLHPSRLARPLLAALLAMAAPSTAGAAAGADPSAGAPHVVRMSGTGSALGPMARLARAFEAANPDVRLRILPSVGSAGAVKAVAAGALDLGFSGRALHPAEAGLGVVAEEVARTPFLLATGPHAGASAMTAAELARILRGETLTWPSGERIRVVLRPASDTDTLFLRALSPELAAALDRAQARPGMLVASTNQDCDRLLARTPGSLGPSTLAQLSTDAPGLTPLAWEGVAPTLANLAAGRYPLAKPIVAVRPAAPSPATSRFLAFLRSPEGRSILEATGCLPTSAPPGP